MVVEHDDETMLNADYICDIGPGAGVHGEISSAPERSRKLWPAKGRSRAITSRGGKKIEVPKHRREGNGKFIEVVGAKENNLKNINVKFPLGEFVCVTGVSGSGKSSLVNEVLYKTLANTLNGARKRPESVTACSVLKTLTRS